jgi:hypothetical protein
MSAPRRRRWMEVLRRTAGVGDGERRGAGAALDDAALWSAQEQAARSLKESGARAERVASAVARQRTAIDAAAERASLIAARSEALAPNAARVSEAFERLGMVALNAGLEGARAADREGRALLLVAEEIRANVSRGADAVAELTRAVDEVAAESAEVRQKLERSRVEVSEVGQEAAHLQAASEQASRSLDDLGALLRRATGIDPEVARLLGLANEHARGLLTALSALTTAAPAATVVGALRPVIAPLARLLGEVEARGAAPAGDEGGDPGGAGGAP